MNKNLIRIIKIIFIFLITLLIYSFSGKEVEATDTYFELEKADYKEESNELTVRLKVKAGINYYDILFNYDNTKMDVIPAISGQIQTGDALRDFIFGSNQELDIGSGTKYMDNLIEIESVYSDTPTQSEYDVCLIKFKLKDTNSVLEEDISNTLFTVNTVLKMVETDDNPVQDNSSFKINPMAKKVESIVPNDDIVLSKTSYLEGEQIEITSGTVTINYSNLARGAITSAARVVDVITLKDNNGNDIALAKDGTWLASTTTPYVNYTYKGIKSNNIDVQVDETPATVVDIALSSNSITLYYGQSLDLITATITPIMSDGTEGTKIDLKDFLNKSNINMRRVGTYTTTVEYEGITKNYTVTVINPVTEIKLEETEIEKIKTDYKYDEEPVTNGAQITVVRYSGDQTKIDITRDMIKDYNKQELGEQTITIMYTEENKKLEQNLKFTVEDYAIDVTLTKPDKTTYKPTEKLVLAGSTLRYVMASGNLGDEVAVTESMISGYDKDKFGPQKIKVTFENFEKYFEVIIVPQTGNSDINIYSSLIMIIETSIIGIFMTLALQKRKEIELIQNVKKL